MSGIKLIYDAINQKGTPLLYTDVLANRPSYGIKGRLFFSTDTGQIFEDNGTSWSLLADAGAGGGSLETVTLNGNTTDQGILITNNGLTSNEVTTDYMYLGNSSGTGAIVPSLYLYNNLGTKYWTNELDSTTGDYYLVDGATLTTRLRLTQTGTLYINGNALGSNAFSSTSYLPLTGGTLSGTLNGTTANFNQTSANFGLTLSSTGTYSPGLSFTNGSYTGNIFLVGGVGDLFFNVGSHLALQLQNSTGNAIFYNQVSAYVFTARNGSYFVAQESGSNLGAISMAYTGSGSGAFGRFSCGDNSGSVPITTTSKFFIGSVTDNFSGAYLQVTGNSTFTGSVTATGLSINNATAAALQLASFIGSGNGSNFSINSANAASQYLQGALAGDVILRTETNNLRIGTVLSTGVISFSNTTNEYMRISGSSGNVLIGTTTDNGNKLQVNGSMSTGLINQSGGIYAATGQFVAGGSTTTTFYTFSNISANQVFLITVRQAGNGPNNVTGMFYSYGSSTIAYNLGQDNTNPVLYLTLSTSGLLLRLTTGSGYGTTTWEYTITQIK